MSVDAASATDFGSAAPESLEGFSSSDALVITRGASKDEVRRQAAEVKNDYWESDPVQMYTEFTKF